MPTNTDTHWVERMLAAGRCAEPTVDYPGICLGRIDDTGTCRWAEGHR